MGFEAYCIGTYQPSQNTPIFENKDVLWWDSPTQISSIARPFGEIKVMIQRHAIHALSWPHSSTSGPKSAAGTF